MSNLPCSPVTIFLPIGNLGQILGLCKAFLPKFLRNIRSHLVAAALTNVGNADKSSLGPPEAELPLRVACRHVHFALSTQMAGFGRPDGPTPGGKEQIPPFWAMSGFRVPTRWPNMARSSRGPDRMGGANRGLVHAPSPHPRLPASRASRVYSSDHRPPGPDIVGYCLTRRRSGEVPEPRPARSARSRMSQNFSFEVVLPSVGGSVAGAARLS